MTSELATRYRRWFEYEKEAHARVAQSLQTVPEDRRGSPEFRRAVDLFAHLAAARHVWLFRMGVVPDPPRQIEPKDADLGAAGDELNSVQDLWMEYLAGLTESELNRTFEYQSTDAGQFRSRVEDVLTQLFGHSLYHRGQIAMLVRAAGGQPAATDFIFWTRETVAR